MRRSVLAALLLLAVPAWPASAQIFPTASPEPSAPTSERVVFDAVVRVLPPTEGGPCLQLEPGRLTVRAINVGTTNVRPARFTLNGYRGEDPGGRVDLTVSQQESATTVPLAGALYCWSWEVVAPPDVTEDAGMAVRTNYSQFIALRMSLSMP